jgi:hypothetical protein
MEYVCMGDKKPYCGIVALSSITHKAIPELEYNINMNRRRPKGTKIVGMQVKELLNELTDSGFEYEIKDLEGKTRFTDYKTDGKTQILILDKFLGDNPHTIVMNNDLFVDSDHTKPTHRSVYKHSLRPIRAVISIKKDGKPFSVLNGAIHEQNK